MLDIRLHLDEDTRNKLLEYVGVIYERDIKTIIWKSESFKFDEIINQLLQYLKDKNLTSGVRLTLNYNISKSDLFYINHSITLPIKELIIDTSRTHDCKIGVLGISFKGLKKIKLINLNICKSIFIPTEEGSFLIEILDCTVEKMTINGGFYCMATNSSISNLYHEGGDQGGTLDFYNIKITNFNIINGKGVNLNLHDTLIGGGRIFDSTINKAEFKKADLGTLSFSQVTFSKPLSIERTSLSKIGLVGINWSPGILSDTNIALEDIQSSYQQLKHNMDEIGNKTEANKFFAKEMEYYRKSLLENYTLRTFFDFGIGQKRIICWYNQLTNDFGNSWIRPLLWMGAIVGIAVLYKYLESDGNIDITDTIRSNILPISEIGKFDSWFSFFYQIAWAALIYQFVVALRRISQR